MPSRNPYPGPRPFTAEEYGIFAGRDYEISELPSLVVSHQVTLLYAQSGAGKTSLVNAGLLRPIQAKGVDVLPVARVGIPLPAGVNVEDVGNVYAYSVIGSLFPEAAHGEREAGATLAGAFKGLKDLTNELGEAELRLLIIDQFEELFSVYPQRWRDRAPFFQQLAELLRKQENLRALLVLREDYLAPFEEFTYLLPERARTRYRLERLGEKDAISAVKKPLNGTGISFDADVAETMVKELMTITVVDPTGNVVAASGEYVEPVQLQVVCYSLAEQLPETSTSITIDDYRRFGDPDRALESYYQNAVAAAAQATGADEGDIRDWCDTRLITPAGTRGLVFRGRDDTGGIANSVVDELEKRHLIRPEIRSGSRWYELTHDRLIRPIQRSNMAWKADRWSKSFDVQYSEAIAEAKARTGVGEEELRSFLDSLAGESGVPGFRPTIPPDAVGVLIGAGLLRRVDDGASQNVALVSPGVAEAVRLANQGWRGENWPEARRLREFQAKADQWSRDPEGSTQLLPARKDAREVYMLIQRAKDSDIGFSKNLAAYSAALRAREVRTRKKWLTVCAVAAGALLIAALLIPALAEDRWSRVLAFLSALGASSLTGMSFEDDDDFAFISMKAFAVNIVVAGWVGWLIGMGTGGLVTSHTWLRWVLLPVTFIVGFMAAAAALGFGVGFSGRQRVTQAFRNQIRGIHQR